MTENRSRTLRSCEDAEGRLYPPRTWDAGWSLSIQADAAGYACSPRACLAALEDYETVEAMIRGPFPGPVDPAFLELPGDVLEKFTPLSDSAMPSLGCHLNRDDIAAVIAAIDRACLNPNAGIPKGVIGWPGRDVFHGTSLEEAQDIIGFGIDMAASNRGYLGQGFYVAEEQSLARSNYADFSEGDEGAVLCATIAPGARILDLRNPKDAETWSESGLARRVSDPAFAAIARRAGIDGVYDRSVGGLAIYNPRCLEAIRLVFQPEAEPSMMI